MSPASTRQPLVGAVLNGIRRKKGVQQRGKDPLLAEQMRRERYVKYRFYEGRRAA
jgi:hypothetical protein